MPPEFEWKLIPGSSADFEAEQLSPLRWQTSDPNAVSCGNLLEEIAGAIAMLEGDFNVTSRAPRR